MTHEDVEPTDTRTITAAPDVYEQLNREYFMGSPLDYFTQRLDGLLNLAAAHPDYTERLRTGIARAGTKIHVPAANVAPTQLDGKKLLAYIVTDSIILHQHAVESLFLAILPELHGSGCPWLEVAGKDARELAADVQRLLDWDAGGRTDALIDVFTRRAATAPPDGFTVDQWAKQAHDLNGWIEDLGRRFLDDRQIYNAAKHGLGVRAAGWELRAGANQDELHQLLNGPAIAYLAHGGWQTTGGSGRGFNAGSTSWICGAALWWLLTSSTHAGASPASGCSTMMTEPYGCPPNPRPTVPRT